MKSYDEVMNYKRQLKRVDTTQKHYKNLNIKIKHQKLFNINRPKRPLIHHDVSTRLLFRCSYPKHIIC